MKKYVIFLSLAMAGLLLICTPNFAYSADILIIKELAGKVLVKIHPSTEWTDAKVGQALNPKDYIKTQENSKVVLEFPEKSNLTLKQNSELSVEGLLWEDAGKKVSVNLDGGEMRAILNKLGPNSEFKVKTPTAVCGSRGTIFYIIASLIETKLYVEDGLIEFRNTMSGESYNVGGGMTSSSKGDGTISSPSEPSQEDKDKITSGWDAGLVAEPYVAPEGGDKRSPDDITPPEVVEETKASQT